MPTQSSREPSPATSVVEGATPAGRLPTPVGGDSHEETVRPPIEQVVSRVARTWTGPGAVLVAHGGTQAGDERARRVVEAVAKEGFDVVEIGSVSIPCLRFSVVAVGALAGLRVDGGPNSTGPDDLLITGPDGLDSAAAVAAPAPPSGSEPGSSASPMRPVGAVRNDSGTGERYFASMARPSLRAVIQGGRPRVVVGAGPGSDGPAAAERLRTLGCEVAFLPVEAPRSSPGPPTSDAHDVLRELKGKVLETASDVGVVLEDEGERVAFVDELGENVPDAVALTLLVRSVLRRDPRAAVVTTLGAPSAFEEAVRTAGGEISWAAAEGDSLARETLRRGARFGGDDRGGYVWPEHLMARDGLASAIELVQDLSTERKPLSKLAKEVEEYNRREERIPLPLAVRSTVLSRVERTLSQGAERTVPIEGVKAYYREGWVLVTACGAEPTCRVVAESRSPDHASQLLDRATTLVRDLARAFDSGDSLGNLWCDSL